MSHIDAMKKEIRTLTGKVDKITKKHETLVKKNYEQKRTIIQLKKDVKQHKNFMNGVRRATDPTKTRKSWKRESEEYLIDKGLKLGVYKKGSQWHNVAQDLKAEAKAEKRNKSK